MMKVTSSPTLPSTLQRTRPSEQPPETPTRSKPSTYKNTIPVIFSGIDAKFQNWRSIMGEHGQHHPSLKNFSNQGICKRRIASCQ